MFLRLPLGFGRWSIALHGPPVRNSISVGGGAPSGQTPVDALGVDSTPMIMISGSVQVLDDGETILFSEVIPAGERRALEVSAVRVGDEENPPVEIYAANPKTEFFAGSKFLGCFKRMRSDGTTDFVVGNTYPFPITVDWSVSNE